MGLCSVSFIDSDKNYNSVSGVLMDGMVWHAKIIFLDYS